MYKIVNISTKQSKNVEEIPLKVGNFSDFERDKETQTLSICSKYMKN